MVRTGIAAVFFFAIMVVSVFAMPHEECTDGSNRSGSDCSSCHTLTIDEANKLLAGVGEVKGIKQAVVRGLFEVTVENKGKQALAYVDYAKKHLLPGPIFSLETKKIVNQSSVEPEATTIKTKIDVASIPLSNSILIGNPEGKKKLFVFTDPDCPFCKKLHWELVKLVYMEPDLEIVVKMFPLKMHPTAYDKARVILGAGTSYLLDKAFAGEQLPTPGEKDSKEPVDESIKLGEKLGVRVTPTLILPDGRMISGFYEAGKLRRLIQGEAE
ncbi:MAG: thioredoxin fold domain-containing protein [Geobacter sp.]|nr:thioredoxin fold domain-containing protein [Geobacter sp.]